MERQPGLTRYPPASKLLFYFCVLRVNSLYKLAAINTGTCEMLIEPARRFNEMIFEIARIAFKRGDPADNRTAQHPMLDCRCSLDNCINGLT
ncbi:MAG: hypothetical protein R6W95_16605 [Desulfosarcina sp.]